MMTATLVKSQDSEVTQLRMIKFSLGVTGDYIGHDRNRK